MSSPELLPVAILAGGLATRLRPITEAIPKALVPVAGEPFIFHQLRYLAEQGIRRAVICTGHLGGQIEDAVGDGSAFGLAATISPDGPKLLGTAGALRRAVPLLGEAFFVLYGDSFLPCDFALVEESFWSLRQPALMTVLRNEGKWDTSNAALSNGSSVRYNKRHPTADMRFIDYGLSVLRGSLFAGTIGDGPADLADLFESLSNEGHLAGLEVTGRFYEIGSHSGLAETEQYLSARYHTSPK